MEGGDWIEEAAEKLLLGGVRAITLDEVGEAIGNRKAGADDVERLIDILERAGAHLIDGQGEALPDLLRRVLATARILRAAGVAPSPAAISEKSGISPRAVRVALLYADVIKG